MEETQIRAAMAGSQAAFGQVMQSQAAYLVRLAQLYVSRDADVQEVISETTLAAFTSIHTLKQPEHFRTWLTKILIRTCYRRYAHNAQEVPQAILPDIPSGEHALSPEVRIDLLNGIRQLNAQYQQTLLMYYYNGLTSREIHEITGLSENTIKTHLCRGKLQLKNWLGGDYFER